jgi:1-acyl-sn-glycerol-3-phosphate acyltransferase
VTSDVTSTEVGFDPFGRDPELIARAQPMLDALLDKYFRVEVEGREHVPQQGRALLVANHGGALPWDAIVLSAALSRGGRAVRPLVEDPVMTAPFLGTLMTRLGCVRASQDNASRLLDRDELVAVFPEGMQGLGKLYKQRHKLQRFGRGGFVRLALRTNAPVIPVAVVGAEDTAPLLAKIELLSFLKDNPSLPYVPVTPVVPLPARWRIRVGEPVDVAGEVHEATARVRTAIQKSVDDLVAARGKVYL